MRLKFVPKAGLCVPHPNRGAGDFPFAGRVVATDAANKSIAYATHSDPVEAEEGTTEADRFIQFVVRDADMHPFDEATAKVCGVPFVSLTRRDDGEWIPAAKTAPVSKKAEG